MGEHDQAVFWHQTLWHKQVDDAHQSIHDDGRTLRPVREDEFVGVYDDFGHRDLERPHTARAAFVFRGGKLIPDTVYIHPDPFLVTGWESHYSDVFALESPKFHYEASFAPVVDDSWRVVGHVGWADGFDICVPGDTVQKGSKFWYILQQQRLGEWRQQLLDEADKFDRGSYPSSRFRAATMSPPPGPKPAPCVPPAPTIKLKPTMWEDARRGPLKEKTIEEVYLNNLNYFVKGGGKALVGLYTYMEIERANNREHSWYGPYLDLKIRGSSGYRFQVLVNPDGYLQAVLGIEKVRPKTLWDKKISDILEGIDIAMTVLMIIDIPVVLFRLGVLVAEKAAIRAAKVVIDEAAKAALKLAEQEAKRLAEAAAREAAEKAAAKKAEEFAVETVVIDAETEARWAARGDRLKLPGEPGKKTRGVGELWRDGDAAAEKFASRSGLEPKGLERTDLAQQPTTHVTKPKPIEGVNKGIPDHLPDASPAEKREWLQGKEGWEWQKANKLDGPTSNLETKAPHAGPRDHDAEAIMFEQVKAKTTAKTTGEFHFKVDHPVCPACRDMIFRFRNQRPGIKVIQHSLDNKVFAP
jgi:hypothetical protein